MIVSLNLTIANCQKQIDALTHHVDSHNQINPLQSVVDNLTAKNKELEK
jgi:hypothetical protein